VWLGGEESGGPSVVEAGGRGGETGGMEGMRERGAPCESAQVVAMSQVFSLVRVGEGARENAEVEEDLGFRV